MIENLADGAEGFTSNAFLVTGERPVLVDAGDEFDVVGAIEERTGALDAIVLTHTHPDHVGNVPAVREAFDVEVLGFDPDHDAVDNELTDDQTITLGDHEYTAVHTPGHAADHLCLYADAAGVLFAGDLVFQNGAYGRTDLPGGDRRTLLESIQRVLDVIDEDLRELHAGHGPSVTEDAYDHVELAAKTARAR